MKHMALLMFTQGPSSFEKRSDRAQEPCGTLSLALPQLDVSLSLPQKQYNEYTYITPVPPDKQYAEVIT
jgi:hypothetical protein